MFRAMLRVPIASREYLATASALDYASADPNEPQIVPVHVDPDSHDLDVMRHDLDCTPARAEATSASRGTEAS